MLIAGPGFFNIIVRVCKILIRAHVSNQIFCTEVRKVLTITDKAACKKARFHAQVYKVITLCTISNTVPEEDTLRAEFTFRTKIKSA